MLPERLKEARKAKGATQEAVADFLGFTRPTYTAYESGRRKPDQDTLIKIAQYLNVSTDYLLGLTNIKDPLETITAHHKNNREMLADPQVRAIARASRKLSSDKKDLLQKLVESMIEEAKIDAENRD